MKPKLICLAFSKLALPALVSSFVLSATVLTAPAQNTDAVIDKIVREETDNSQLTTLAHELFDGIGPRLVGTPQMDKANEWAVAKYKGWGITARNEKWGEWRGW